MIVAALYSIGHGGNDAQNTMGVIVALLIAAGTLPSNVELSLTDHRTAWIILSCHLAMAIGTAFGGWRIVWAWILTIPAAATIATVVFHALRGVESLF